MKWVLIVYMLTAEGRIPVSISGWPSAETCRVAGNRTLLHTNLEGGWVCANEDIKKSFERTSDQFIELP